MRQATERQAQSITFDLQGMVMGMEVRRDVAQALVDAVEAEVWTVQGFDSIYAWIVGQTPKGIFITGDHGTMSYEELLDELERIRADELRGLLLKQAIPPPLPPGGASPLRMVRPSTTEPGPSALWKSRPLPSDSQSMMQSAGPFALRRTRARPA